MGLLICVCVIMRIEFQELLFNAGPILCIWGTSYITCISLITIPMLPLLSIYTMLVEIFVLNQKHVVIGYTI